MPTQEDITNLQDRLAIYRRVLVQYLLQEAAQGGTTFALPSIRNGIHEARDNIKYVKEVLRQWGVVTDDHPDDEWPKHILSPTLDSPPHRTNSMVVSGLSPSLPRLLVGRSSDISELVDRLTSTTNITLLTAVRGWPGVGKTTLAAAVVHEPKILKDFPDGVLWIALGSQPDLLFGLGEWLVALGEDPRPFSTIEGRSRRLAAILRERRMLLIIDDVWEAVHAHPFCMGGQNCRTLITTRHLDTAHDLAITEQAIYRLDVLSDGNALALLTHLAPKAIESNLEATQNLVKMLEGLPLALQVAGRLLATESISGTEIGNLVGELSEGTKILQEKAPLDRTDIATMTTPTVAALFRKSTDLLDTSVRQRFALLGLFVPKPATFEANAAAAGWGIDNPEVTLQILVNRGLLERVTGDRYQLHSLLAMHAKSLLSGG